MVLMKKTICLLLLFAIVFINYSTAQEIIAEPKAKLISRFPFRQYNGGVMMIHATVGDIADTLNFILDTGSGGISLDSATCATLKIPVVATDTSITGIGGVRKVAFLFDETLHLPGITVKHLNFHVNNYEVLSSVYGEKVDGIIGYSFFSRYIVNIDFDSSYVSVYNPGKITYPKPGHTLRPAFTALPIQWIQIKDRRKMANNFYFDTGAGLCFLLSEQYASDSNVLLSRRKPVVTQAQGMGGKLQMRITVIKDVKLGPYHFRQVPVYLYDDAWNVTSYPFTGGLIGNDLLRRFNITLNYPKREIHLTPNNHFKEPFDYAYTGLGIYYVDNKVMVDDVIEASPAAKAGFKPGDEVVAVGTNFSGNINTYKNLLQVADQEVKVIIRRSASLVVLNMKVASIR
jgi:hypothetical protein